MRAAIYARVSSKAQADRHTIQSQLRVLRAFASSSGWTVAAEYVDDGRSARAGQLERRDGFARLVADAERKAFDLVLVVDIDRLTRTDDMAERAAILGPFQRLGIDIVTPTTGRLDLRTMLGELYATLHAVVAAEENRKRSERTKAGLARARAEGRKPSGMAPFGYRFDRDSGWSIDGGEAALVREMFERVVAGDSCREIDADFEARGVRRPRGGPWGFGRTWRIVTSPAYRGEWRVPVPPIVSDELWHAAQARIAEFGQRHLRRVKHFYLLDDLAVCERCGGSIGICSHGLDAAGRPRRPTTYVCDRRRRPAPGMARCELPHARQLELDEALWGSLVEFSARPDLVERALRDRSGKAAADGRAWQDDVQGAKARLARLQRAEEAILARYRSGLVSEGALDTELVAIAQTRKQLGRQLAAAVRGAASAGRAVERAAQLAATIDEVRARIHRATPQERQRLVRALLGQTPVIMGEKEVRAMVSLSAAGVGPASQRGRNDEHVANLRFRLVARAA